MDGKSSHLDHEKASTSHSGRAHVNVNVPAIFLSHSGKQKAFVEHLFKALECANHTPFFDKHSLPKGAPFPDHIKEAALGCRLGVVVLSEDFLTSKWPMLELEMLVLRRGPKPKVFPVCYKLNFEDLKSNSNISRWRSAWEEIEGRKHIVDQWEKAVRALARFNGEICVPRSSEITYITQVVHHICRLVPCPTPFDMSLIGGHQRLAKEIASMFDRVKETCAEESTCVVGLYGVGGLGKTTLCGSMVNYYTSEYLGRSYLIEFPTDGDRLKITQACKGALRKLANLGTELLDGVNSFEQVLPLMKEHMKKYDVFLAIDNVWENSWEEARRLLSVVFSATSKILLTSRGEPVLKDLLRQHTNKKWEVGPLPTPNHEEALQIFQETFDPGNLCSLLDIRGQIDILLNRCRFGGSYHPLALKALARHLSKVCPPEDLQNSKHRWSVGLEEISRAHLKTVEDVMRLSYDGLPQTNKHMFLDIAIFFTWKRHLGDINFNNSKYHFIHSWMCLCYNELSETQVTALIRDLASDGLIQLIEAGYSDLEKRVTVHDLYIELAHKEAASSPRFFASGVTSSSREEIEWESLERVLIIKDEDTCFFENIGERECKKLHILHIDGVSFRSQSEIRLDFMPRLRVLSLRQLSGIRDAFGWAHHDPERVIKVNALVQLLSLSVGWCASVVRITGLDALPNLKNLTLKNLLNLKELEGMNGLIRLEHLEVDACYELKTMSGLTRAERPSFSPSLRRLVVQSCGVLEKMPSMGGLTCLETLVLSNNTALDVEVSGEYLTSTLKCLKILGCKSVRRFPSLNECVDLEELRADEGVINNFRLLQKLPKLQILEIRKSHWRSDVFNEQWKNAATCLQLLTISECGSIEKLEIGGGLIMSSLKVLMVEVCNALEEIGDLSALHCLEDLSVYACPRLKKVGGLRGISAHLRYLILHRCTSLEESSLTDVSLLNSIEYVSISDCGNCDDWRTKIERSLLNRRIVDSWARISLIENL